MANISSLSSVNLQDNPTLVRDFVLPIDSKDGNNTVSTQKITLRDIRDYILNTSNNYSTDVLTPNAIDIGLCTTHGFVGIGTGTPLQKLHVAGSTYIDGALTVTGFVKGTATNAQKASKWSAARSLTFKGAVTGIATGIDGSSNMSTTLGIPPSTITESHLVPGAFGTTKIANGAITFDKLAADCVRGTNIPQGAISGVHVADGTVPATKMAASTAFNAGKYINPSVTVNAGGIITNIVETAGGGGAGVYPREVHVSTAAQGISGLQSDGSINSPFTTIFEAVSSLEKDDTHIAIILHPGTYDTTDGLSAANKSQFVIDRPNTHFIGVGVADKFSAVVIDGDMTINTDTSGAQNIVSFSNLTLVNQSVTAADMVTLSGTDTQSVIFREVAVRERPSNTASNVQLFSVANSACTVYFDDCKISSYSKKPLIHVETGNLQVIDSTFNALHKDAQVIRLEGSGESGIHKSTLFAENNTCLLVEDDTTVDVTYCTLRANLSNSSGIYIIPSSAAALPKVTAINNIFNIPRGSGFAIRTAASATFDHAFNTYLSNQTVLTGGSLSALPTTFALVSAAEFAIPIVIKILDITSIDLIRDVRYIQSIGDDVLTRTYHPSLSNVFTATISTDSEAVTAIDLTLPNSDVIDMTSAGALYSYTSSMSGNISGFDASFDPDGTYSIVATSLSTVTTTNTALSTSTRKATVVLSAFDLEGSDLANMSFPDLPVSATTGITGLSTLSGESTQDLISLYLNLTGLEYESDIDVWYDLNSWPLSVISAADISAWGATLSTFSGSKISLDQWSTDVLSGMKYVWSPLAWGGVAYTSGTGTGRIFLNSSALSTQISAAPTLGHELTSFTLSDFGLYSIDLSAFNLPVTFVALTGLNGNASFTFNYTNSGEAFVQVISTFPLSSYVSGGSVSLVYEFDSLTGTGTINLNTSAYHSIVNTTQVSSVNLSTVVSAFPASASILQSLSSLTGSPGSFSLELSSNHVTAYDTFTELYESELTATSATISVSAMGAYFNKALNSVELSGFSGLSGDGDVSLFNEHILEVTTVSTDVSNPVVYNFKLTGSGDFEPLSTVPFISNLSSASAIPASASYAVEINPLPVSSLNINLTIHDTATSVKVIDTISKIDTSAIDVTGVYTTGGEITSIELPTALLTSIGPLTGIFTTSSKQAGSGDVLGIPVMFTDNDTLYFDLSVTEPIIIPVTCITKTIIVTVSATSADGSFFLYDGSTAEEYNDAYLGINNLYVFVLSTPWLSGASDTENSGNHPFSFSDTKDGDWGGGNTVAGGVTGLSASKPGINGMILLDTSNSNISGLSAIHTWCGSHSGMGGKFTFHGDCSSTNVTARDAVLSTISACSIDEYDLYQSLDGPASEGNNVGKYRYAWHLNSNRTLAFPADEMNDRLVLGFHNEYTFRFPESLGTDNTNAVYIGHGLSSDSITADYVTLGQTATALTSSYASGQGAVSGGTITLSTFDTIKEHGNRLFMYTLTGGGSDMSSLSTSTAALTTRDIFAEIVLVNTCNGRYDTLINDYMIDNQLSAVTTSGTSASPGFSGWGGY